MSREFRSPSGWRHYLAVFRAPGSIEHVFFLLVECRPFFRFPSPGCRISGFHSEVSRMLTSIGVPHSIEYLLPDQLFSVDIALPAEHIVIEVDGPCVTLFIFGFFSGLLKLSAQQLK
jgi:hypothetical protein